MTATADRLNEKILRFPVGGWDIEVTHYDRRRYLTIRWKAKSKHACLTGSVCDINHGVFSVAAMLKKSFNNPQGVSFRVRTA